MSDSVNIAAYIGVIYPMLLLVSFGLVFIYAEQGFPWHSYFTLTVGYFASFGILFLVPIDIASIVIARRSTSDVASSGYNDYRDTISPAYSTFFSLVLIFGSVILVFEEYYNTDGYFTFATKIWSSFKRMVIDTILGVIAGVIILSILIAKKVVDNNASALELSAVIVTNTIYETILMFLLGYGLVEFPRSLWLNSSLDGYLLKIQNKASYEFKNISDAQLNVSLVVSDVIKTKEQLASYANQQLNDAMTIILAECPSEFRSSRMGNVATNKSGQVTIDSLAALRTRLNTMKDRYRMAQATSIGTKILAYELEDIVAAKNKNSGVVHWSLTNKDSTHNEYLWYTKFKPYMLKFASISTFTLSILSFVGVICTMNGVSIRKTPYFKAIHDNNTTAAGIVFFIFLTLGYTAYITFWSLFQMKLVGYVELVPGRTTPEALSFNVRMCARLAAPLVFFYLGWIAEDGLKSGPWEDSSTPNTYEYMNVTFFNSTTNSTQTSLELVAIDNTIVMASSFSNFYKLQDIPFIKKSFGIIFPIMLYCIVGLILPNIMNRLLVLLKLDYLQFGDVIVTEEQLREGKRQLERHKTHTARTFQRSLLRSYISSLAKRDVSADGTIEGDGGGLLSGIWKKLRKTKPETKLEDAGPILVEPPALSGLIEKKGSGSYGLGGSWAEVIAEVEPPGTLVFKDKKTYNRESTVDLTSIIMFNEHKTGKESKQLDLELGKSTVILRFKTEEDQMFWKASLIAWKDYATDYANLYPDGEPVRDPELGFKSSIQGSSETRGSHDKKAKASGGSKPQALDELDSIVVEEDDDDDSPSRAKPLIRSGFFGLGKKPAPEEKRTAQPVVDLKPSPLEGWLEKKSNAKVQFGNDWQRRYVRIDETTSSLLYFKTSSADEKPSGSLDLRLTTNIAAYDKGAKSDASRFNVEFGEGERVYKFKAASASEGERWVRSLNDWRDYFLLRSRTL